MAWGLRVAGELHPCPTAPRLPARRWATRPALKAADRRGCGAARQRAYAVLPYAQHSPACMPAPHLAKGVVEQHVVHSLERLLQRLRHNHPLPCGTHRRQSARWIRHASTADTEVSPKHGYTASGPASSPVEPARRQAVSAEAGCAHAGHGICNCSQCHAVPCCAGARTCRQAAGLDHDGGAMCCDKGFGLLGVGEGVILRGGNVVPASGGAGTRDRLLAHPSPPVNPTPLRCSIAARCSKTSVRTYPTPLLTCGRCSS